MRLAPLVLLTVLVSAPASAQNRPQSDSLPRDLVIALLGGMYGGMRNVGVHAGLADDSIPPAVFRDAVVLGFADYGPARTTVAYFPYTPQVTLDTIRARLVADGWRLPPEPRDSTRGFVSVTGGRYVDEGICRGSSMIHPTVQVRTINRTLAVMSRTESFGARGPCGDAVATPRRLPFQPAANTPLPALPPPAGMTSRGGGSSGSAEDDDGVTMRSELLGALPLRDIMSHYSALFTKAGWRKVEDLLGTSVAIAAFVISERGKSWHCSFVASVPSANIADVQLTLRSVR